MARAALEETIHVNKIPKGHVRGGLPIIPVGMMFRFPTVYSMVKMTSKYKSIEQTTFVQTWDSVAGNCTKGRMNTRTY